MTPNRRALPLQLTSFVGREHEVAAVRALLGRTRLLTLCGPGGVGKTRLALEATAGLTSEYADGVWFVELAPLAHASLVARAVASAGGVAEDPGVSVDITLAESLGERQVLLLLDNCEHLIEPCAQLVSALLRACSGLRVLATSREPLGIDGEVTRQVPALTLPPADTAPEPESENISFADSEAVRLFVERAAAARPDFELTHANAASVARVCRRLDGVPLAIELAAACVRALTPAQIADRLDDRFSLLTGGNRTAPPRHQTLHATVSWSYDLLTQTERTLFRRLSVFSGGWTLEAAEAVCGDITGVLGALTRLVDRSLVLAEDGNQSMRYRFLETIRQFAHERLVDANGDIQGARRAHALHFLALAETVEPWLYTADGPKWMALLTTEHDNLRASFRWALETREAELAMRFGASLYRFWRQRGHVREGRAWLAEALDASAATPIEEYASRRARARALNGAGVLARGAGDFAASRPLLEHSLALFELLGEDEPIANTEQNLGQVLFGLGESDAARAHLQASLERLRGLSGKEQVRSAALVGCLNILGKLALREGDLDAARRYIFEAEVCSRRVGSPHFIAHALIELGVLHLSLAEHARAWPALHEALSVAAGAQDRWCTLQALHALACVAANARDTRRAAVLNAAFEAHGQRVTHGDISADLVPPASAAQLRASLAGLDPVVRATAEATGAAMPLEEAVTYALTEDAPPVADDRRSGSGGVLSAREQEVARLVVRGYTNRQIAEALVIAEPTAERHIANIFAKLGVHSRAQVAAWAAEHVRAGM